MSGSSLPLQVVDAGNDLLRWLPHDFDQDPGAVMAFTIAYDGQMVWTVDDDGVFSTETAGGTGSPLRVSLAGITIANLAAIINAQPGYDIVSLGDSATVQLGAMALIRTSVNIADPGGNRIMAYSNPNWALLEAIESELDVAQGQIGQMPAELSATTADSDFLDTIGALYGVPRLQGEPDAAYQQRIPAEVVRPKCNNVALEMAIEYFTGQECQVNDVVVYTPDAPLWNGFLFNGSTYFNGVQGAPQYGLFDVVYGYDLVNGASDFTTFASIVTGVVNGLRAAGTHMRNLTLTGSALSETVPPPSDEAAILVALAEGDAVTPPSDVGVISILSSAGNLIEYLDGSSYP